MPVRNRLQSLLYYTVPVEKKVNFCIKTTPTSTESIWRGFYFFIYFFFFWLVLHFGRNKTYMRVKCWTVGRTRFFRFRLPLFLFYENRFTLNRWRFSLHTQHKRADSLQYENTLCAHTVFSDSRPSGVWRFSSGSACIRTSNNNLKKITRVPTDA